MFILFLTNALFASTYTIGKVLLGYIGPIYLNALRMGIAGLILLAVDYTFFPKKKSISRRSWFYLVKIAFFNTYLCYVLEFWAMVYVSSIKVTFIYNMAPLITPIYSYFFFSEQMTVKKVLGLVIGIAGIVPILFMSSGTEASLHAVGVFSWPEIALFVAVAAYCYGWVFMRKLVREYDCSPITINGWVMLFGGLFSLINAMVMESWVPIDQPYVFAGWLAALIIIGNLVCSTLYTSMFKHYTITFISFTGFTIPLFASVLGYFFLGESVTWQFLLSSVMVVIGLYIFYQEELRQGYVIPKKKRDNF